MASGPLLPVADERLARQIAFLVEIDRLKQVLRRSLLTDGSRRENSAEHSWHLAVMACVLAEHAAAPVDLERVLKMLLVHDIVEIEAGDTFIYDEQARAAQTERERQAAERLFGLLPADQGGELRALWEEFEARQTPEARFAAALDRLQPLLQNYASGGRSWQEHGVHAERVRARNAGVLREGSPALWELARQLIDDAVARGYLAEPDAP
ncbi:MAG TPA: HD domain-containing protein [Bacillota bacterium]